MSKGDHLELEGVVTDAMGGGQYNIRLTETQKGEPTYVLATIGGKMKQRKIRVLPGDRVQVSVSPYDTTHGFINRRYK